MGAVLWSMVLYTVLHSTQPLQPLQEVLLSSKTLHLAGTKKLRARYVGPFRVKKNIGRMAYRLDLKGRFKQVHNIFYVY